MGEKNRENTIAEFTNSINTIRYLIHDDDLNYLVELRKKAIDLQALIKQENSMRLKAEQQHYQGLYETAEQKDWHNTLTKVGELNTWFAAKIDELHKI